MSTKTPRARPEAQAAASRKRAPRRTESTAATTVAASAPSAKDADAQPPASGTRKPAGRKATRKATGRTASEATRKPAGASGAVQDSAPAKASRKSAGRAQATAPKAPSEATSPKASSEANPAKVSDKAPIEAKAPKVRRDVKAPQVPGEAKPAKAAAPTPRAAARGRAPQEAPAPADDARTSRARKPRAARAGTAERPAAAAAPAAGEGSASAAIGTAAEIDPPAGGALFGDYEVRIPDEEAATVSLRAPTAGSAYCTCLDFMLSEDGDCPHLQALLPHLQADPARAAELARAPQRPGGRVVLRHGARRRPLWLPGADCPPLLDALARKVFEAEAAAFDDQALARVLRAAREAGHDVQVDDDVWELLATARDMHARVQRLETLFEQGPASAELQALAVDEEDGRLLPLQAEGALFAVCAGRCILADAALLQPMRQALAAALLWQRHFGVERVLVLAPRSLLPRWQRALPEGTRGFELSALESVAQDGQRLRAGEPELVIVHEDDSGLWIDPERAAALLRLPAGFAIVLPAPGWQQRAAELPLRVAFVDAHRLGAYEALLQAHGQRDEDGALCGLHDLQELRQTLAPVLLARTLDELRDRLPERVESVRRVAMPASVQAGHAAMCAALASTMARWQQAAWMPDRQQRRLVAQVQALRRLCAGAEAPAVAAAKAAALLRLLDEGGGGAPVAKAVVFSQWPQALQTVRAALAAGGVDAASWSGDEPASAREAARQRFQDEPACRVLLVADPGSGALELRVPQAQVVHLDRPWNPRVLSRRFGRVHRRGTAQLVPVTQLLLQGSFEDACLQVLADRREPPVTDVLDALADEGFAQGPACARWLADLGEVLQRCREPAGADAPAPGPHS